MTNPTYDLVEAVHDRVQAIKGDDDTSYDVLGITEAIYRDGVAVTDVADIDFMTLMMRHAIQDRTALPCPPWCRYEAGHPFESMFDDGRQSRPTGESYPDPTLRARSTSASCKRTSGTRGTTRRPFRPARRCPSRSTPTSRPTTSASSRRLCSTPPTSSTR